MHLTLNLLKQQARFDAFLSEDNEERPHQAMAMKVPADVYTPSHRRYQGLGELDYPLRDWAATVTHCGRICFKSRKVNLSQVFAGQQVGVRHVDEHIWLVTFMQYDLGYFDDETCRLEPIEDPFGPRLLPMSPE
jgi:putative transposase